MLYCVYVNENDVRCGKKRLASKIKFLLESRKTESKHGRIKVWQKQRL